VSPPKGSRRRRGEDGDDTFLFDGTLPLVRIVLLKYAHQEAGRQSCLIFVYQQRSAPAAAFSKQLVIVAGRRALVLRLFAPGGNNFRERGYHAALKLSAMSEDRKPRIVRAKSKFPGLQKSFV
jgi:hypothetical protein